MSTKVQFVDRDEVVASMPQTDNPVNVREEEKDIAELLRQVTQARRDFKLSEKHLAALEESLAGKSE